MDTQRDYEPFRDLLNQLCAVWDRPPAKEEQVKAYWHALKDARFKEVRANAERIMRTANGKAIFPKPADLLNEAPTEHRSDGSFEAGEQRAIRNLEELRRTDEKAWLMDVKLRWLDRQLATLDPSSPVYAQALEESRVLRPLVRGY